MPCRLLSTGQHRPDQLQKHVLVWLQELRRSQIYRCPCQRNQSSYPQAGLQSGCLPAHVGLLLPVRHTDVKAKCIVPICISTASHIMHDIEGQLNSYAQQRMGRPCSLSRLSKQGALEQQCCQLLQVFKRNSSRVLCYCSDLVHAQS